MSADFVHLHVHTQFSLLDGAIKLSDLFQKAAADQMEAVAITDHGNMHGLVQFFQQAKHHDIKPIIGCEVYVAHGSRHDLSNRQPSPYHLVLLVENEKGFHNLTEIVTKAHLEGKTAGIFGRPRCDHELLEKHNEGLVAMSACLQGEVPRAILERGVEKATEVADYYRQLFPGRYYIELQRNGLEEQNKVNVGLLQIAKDLQLPIVATNDCHYLNREHAKSHEILLCIQTGRTMNDERRFKFSTDEVYFRTKAEMAEVFADLPEALSRTKEIQERCNFELAFGNPVYPTFSVPLGEDLNSYFITQSEEGLNKRLQKVKADQDEKRDGPWKDQEKVYRDRLATEIKLIMEKGFAGYFLIVQDIISWARKQKIPVGPGRGSAAGSLVSYSLGITNIDPIHYVLLFERFLNPERQDNPDIDIDFCAERREEVLEYVSEKYGKECVAQIAAFGSMKAKAAIKDVGRGMGFSYGEVETIAKLIPDVLNITLDNAEKDPDVGRMLKQSEWVRDLWFHAKALEGLARHATTHAAGVIIADKPLVEYVPLMLDKDNKLITQWDKNDVEKIGLIKFDFLGLKTLTVIDKSLAMIRDVYGEDIDIDDIPMDDPDVFDLLGRGLSTGVFQFESAGMKDLLVRIHPDDIEDLIAIAALYRPGPIGSGMIDDFIARKKGEQEVTYDLPELEEILETTYGMMVYQEQVQQVAHAVGGFSLGEADLMRRAMARKKTDQMETFHDKFSAGGKEKNTPAAMVERIWNMMEKFAEYGFNKSHSAAYAVVAYQTAWLKAKYPPAFMAALMTMDKGESTKIMAKIAECRDLEIEVLPPDVNESYRDFSVTKNGKIRFGLSAVKNVGEGAVNSVIEARKDEGPFKGIFDFAKRVDSRKINRRVVESLVKCGAFDSIEENRAALLEAVEPAMELAAREQADREAGQTSMFGVLEQSGGNDGEPALPAVAPWTNDENMRYEKEALGFFITGHPLEQHRRLIERYTNCDAERLRDRSNPDEVRIAAVISSLDKKTTRTGRTMATGIAEDHLAQYKITVFSETLEKSREVLEDLEQPVLLFGKVDVRDGGNGLIVDRIIPLVQAREVCSNEVHFRIRASGLSKGHLERLKACMERHTGSSRAFIHIIIPGRSEATFALPARPGLQASDQLAEEIRAIFGQGVITFQ